MKIEQTDEIFQHFEKYIKLSDTLKSELANRVVFKSFKKGKLVHNADTICTKSYFIQKRTFTNLFYQRWKRNK